MHLSSRGFKTMKTKIEFLKNCRNPELAKKVLNQMGEEWKEIISRPEDFRDASAGVSGFIYYSETIPFAKRNLVLIINALNEFEQDCGLLGKPTDDETQYYNWLSWFALENTIDDIMNFKEA